MKRELRAAQLIGAGGVGSIIDMGDESFVVEDISEWQKGEAIKLERLESRLRARIHSPPTSVRGRQGGRVEIKRFPGALFCVLCRHLVTDFDERKGGRHDGGRPDCPNCRKEGTLTPMRFVLACRNGHLQDVPWRCWAHSRPDRRDCRDKQRLFFRIDESGGVGGLKSLYVECEACDSKRDLEQLPQKNAMTQIGHRCSGGHPWHADTVQCDEPMLALQRGATNLHYADTVSALDIGRTEAAQNSVSTSDLEALLSDEDFEWLKESLQTAPTVGNHVNRGAERLAKGLARNYGLSAEEILHLAQGSATQLQDQGPEPDKPLAELLLDEEWAFLSSPTAASVSDRNLVIRESPQPRFRANLQPFSRVLLIDRLREVRALTGFRRIDPGAEMVAVDIGRGAYWIPALEIFGEGIFLQFDEDYVADWEDRLKDAAMDVIRESLALEERRARDKFWFLPRVSPRFIAIHTFSHLLMRQLTFECGYSSSALRERVWADVEAKKAGILIYTADGDSEGALGGLVRQGQPDRLGDLIVSALDKAAWCSADPVCTETKGQGLGGFNRGACHACSLVPETSCIHANTLLSRLHVVGRHDVMPGLLEGI